MRLQVISCQPTSRLSVDEGRIMATGLVRIGVVVAAQIRRCALSGCQFGHDCVLRLA